MSVWAELKRRNVFKVGAAYAIVGWLLVQVAVNFFPTLQLPPWTVTFVAVIVLLGFPIALLLAWAYELTPEGIKKTRQVPLSESIRQVTGQKLNYVVTGLLVVAVVAIALDDYFPWRPTGSRSQLGCTAEAPPQSGAAATGAELGGRRINAIPGRPPTSVAVLPLDNLTADPAHAFFASGIHEELLTQLAKVGSLAVTSRRSVERYATDRPPIPEIATALNVSAVMEGSVRYAGNCVLVTVQLIDAATDSHVWSQSYPGDLSDLRTIFALQADIAMNVANALRAQLTPAELASIEQPPTDSREAYELYLAAGDPAVPLTRRLELIDEAIRLDPDFAGAWARKSGIHGVFVLQVPLARVAEEQAKAEEAVRHAIDLDDDWAGAYAELGFALSQRSKPVEAEHAFRKAGDLGLADLGVHGILLLSAANFTKARTVFEAYRDSDPLNPDGRVFLLVSYAFEGNVEAAKEEYARGRALYGDWRVGDAFMVWLLLGSGDMAAAKELLASSPIGSGPIGTAVREHFDSPSEALARLRELRTDPTNENLPTLINIAMWAASFGDAEFALDVMEQLVAANSQSVYLFWYPQMRDVRRLPEFKTIIREAGFVDYWNEFGWPDVCHKTAGDDFECA